MLHHFIKEMNLLNLWEYSGKIFQNLFIKIRFQFNLINIAKGKIVLRGHII